eukprot:241979-Chlamydomonas_euryale.AAC.4
MFERTLDEGILSAQTSPVLDRGFHQACKGKARGFTILFIQTSLPHRGSADSGVSLSFRLSEPH